MIRLLKRINRYKGFKAAELTESISALNNPGRGWFSLYSFAVDEEFDPNQKFHLSDDETLVLVLADIGAFRDEENLEDALLRLDKVIDFFYEKGKDIILRVAYDHEGKGMEKEPSAFKTVLKHAEQVACFVQKHRNKIFLYQGLLIGRWGEMHTSKFTDTEKIKELNAVFEKNIGNSVFRAVRRPVQWRMLRFNPSLEEGVKTEGLGIFNDGMFGSDSDLGTFDSTNKNDISWSKAWNREKETEFIGKIAHTVPIGGEALFGEGFVSMSSPDRYIDELSVIRATYLNGHYDDKLIDYWKKTGFNKKGIWGKSNFYEYIEAHLGYRFVIRSAEVLKSAEDITIKVEIENCGFADIYKETLLYIEITGSEGTFRDCFKERLNSCHPGEVKSFSIELRKMTGRVYLCAKQSEKKSVYFANEPLLADGKLVIGEITG